MLKDWPLSARTLNCLRELRVRFVGDLVPYTRGVLLRSNNFGKKSFEELSIFFDKYSLKFGDDVDASWDDVREKLVNEDKLFYKKEMSTDNRPHNFEEQERHYTISRSILEEPRVIYINESVAGILRFKILIELVVYLFYFSSVYFQ